MTTSTLDSSLVQEIRPLEDLRWEDLVARHPRSSIFHTTAWLKALQRTYGYQPVVVTKANSGERLTTGLVFCKVQSWLTGPRWVSLPFSDHCAPLTDGSQYLEACLSEIQCAVGREHLRYVELRPGPDFEGIGSVMCSGAWRPARSYCLSHLDLTPNLDTLFRKCHKDSTQRKICRARREQLRYEEGRAPALLDAFYRLLILTRKRHGLPPQPKQWFQNLAECFGPALKIRVASQGHPGIQIRLFGCGV
jgi:CelD/BcsL family acetyltransferase involved in cellulose biosynthesis